MNTARVRVAVAALAAVFTLAEAAIASAASSFEQYRAAPYSGPRHAPVLTGKFRQFRTMIREGFSQGHQFAGHYVLFGRGCGTDCGFWTVGDLKTGRLWNFPLGGEGNLNLQLVSRPNSRLVKAYWETTTDPATAACDTEDLVWTGVSFTQGKMRETGGACPQMAR